MDPSSGWTCVSCRLVFKSADLQRDHYKTEWHRYNLKRQVAELPPVSEEQFQLRVLAYREEKRATKEEQQAAPSFCAACNKQFQSKKAFENHLQSKKHEENERKKPKGPKQQPPTQRVSMEVDNEVEESDDEEDDDSSSGWVTDHGTDDEDDGLDESLHSSSLDANVEHMKVTHGFSVPDATYCDDLKGLVKYLGLKVGAGRACIFCPDTRTRFTSVDACQKHMRDKEHCKLNRDAEAMLELADFYDYSPMYNEGDENSEDVLVDDGFTLTLPSGAKIGHRSLMRFYKQHLRPVADESKSDRAGKAAVRKAIEGAKGGALAWTGTTGALAVKTAKDIKFIEKIRAKHLMRLGVKSNKLFKSRGRADQ